VAGKFKFWGLHWFEWMAIVLIGTAVLWWVLNPLPRRTPIVRLRVVGVQMGAFSNALVFFKGDNGFFPSTSAGLNALVVRPAQVPNWQQYLANVPMDPWGNAYRYEFPGKHNTNGFDLSSAGPDGVVGTADDIKNW